MKYILVIDGVVSTKYKYNVWTVNEVVDPDTQITAYQQDTRVFETDSFEELVTFLKRIYP